MHAPTSTLGSVAAPDFGGVAWGASCGEGTGTTGSLMLTSGVTLTTSASLRQSGESRQAQRPWATGLGLLENLELGNPTEEWRQKHTAARHLQWQGALVEFDVVKRDADI
jgi:hypothetical protein